MAGARRRDGCHRSAHRCTSRSSARLAQTRQDVVGTGGVGSYEFLGWTSGYPEVTGYIIPTMWDCHQIIGDPDLGRRATCDGRVGAFGSSEPVEGGKAAPSRTSAASCVQHRPSHPRPCSLLRGTGDERFLKSAIRAAGLGSSRPRTRTGVGPHRIFKQMRRVYDSMSLRRSCGLPTRRRDDLRRSRATELRSSRSHSNTTTAGSI